MLGINAKLYRNSGTYGSPTWTPIDNVGDLSVNPPWEEGDATTRGSRVKLSQKTVMALEVTGKIRADLTDTEYLAMADAGNQDTVNDYLVLSATSATNGARGFRFDGQVHVSAQDQNLGSVIFDDFTLKPTPSANKVQRVTVTAGAPVFVAI
jgi:hypothetical protein